MILIVEKECIVGLSIKQSLEKLKRPVCVVKDWDEAREIILKQKPSCVITGDTALFNHADKRNIIHNYLVKRNISVIFTTFDSIPETSYDINVVNVLRKPFVNEELNEQLEELLMMN